MPIPTDTKNDALDALGFTAASLHTAWPGMTGGSEVSGGDYARQTITVTDASGGSRTLSASVAFNIPASTTVRWVGLWDGTTFRAAMPNGGATPKNFMALSSNSTVYAAGHGWTDTQPIVFFNGTPPGGLTEGTVYYVRSSDDHTFKVAATAGGSPINLTSAASFGCVVAAITEDVYPATGTHQLTTGTVTIPD